MQDLGIYPILVGGLGNQMFIAAAGFVISKTLGIPLYLCKQEPSKNPHNLLHIDYRETIFSKIGISIQMSEEEIQTNSYTIVSPPGFGPWSIQDLQKESLILKSYFQYYPPHAQFESEIRRLFLKGIELNCKLANLKIKTPLTSAFLHIRRGDYLKNPTLHYIQPLTYYEKGVEQLLKKNTNITKIYILSDDIEWVKNQEFFNNSIFKIQDIQNELQALAFMSECKGGAICANSTFSWWGAFLGAYENRSPVIVPERWIAEPIVNLFPPEWIII